MKKIDILNLIGGIAILLFGISYLFRGEHFKSGFGIAIGILLIAPVIIKKRK